MTSLELILSEILEKSSARRPQAAGKKNPLARGQKISSPKTPPFFARSPKESVAKLFFFFFIQPHYCLKSSLRHFDIF